MKSESAIIQAGVTNEAMVTIRDYRHGDLDEVLEIAVSAWTPIYRYYREIMGGEMFDSLFSDWPERKKQQIRIACSGSQGDCACTAEQYGQIAGFITYRVHGDGSLAEIGNNAVSPDHQGKGIGQRMYKHVFRKLKEQGVRYVEVATGGDLSHAPARAAYEKVGFSVQIPSVRYYMTLP